MTVACARPVAAIGLNIGVAVVGFSGRSWERHAGVSPLCGHNDLGQEGGPVDGLRQKKVHPSLQRLLLVRCERHGRDCNDWQLPPSAIRLDSPAGRVRVLT